MARVCQICPEPATNIWRCEAHSKCDGCGTQEKLCFHQDGVWCDDCDDLRLKKQIADFDGDTDYTDEVICPHCGHEHSDSWELMEGRRNCHRCDREFLMEREVTVTYITSRIEEVKKLP